MKAKTCKNIAKVLLAIVGLYVVGLVVTEDPRLNASCATGESEASRAGCRFAAAVTITLHDLWPLALLGTGGFFYAAYLERKPSS